MLSHEGSNSDQLEVLFCFFSNQRRLLWAVCCPPGSHVPRACASSCPSRVRDVLRACDPCHEGVTALARSLEEHQLTRDCSVRR